MGDAETYVTMDDSFMKPEGSGHDAGPTDESAPDITGALIDVEYQLKSVGSEGTDSSFFEFTFVGCLMRQRGYEWRITSGRHLLTLPCPSIAKSGART